jgi:hypothetical protein
MTCDSPDSNPVRNTSRFMSSALRVFAILCLVLLVMTPAAQAQSDDDDRVDELEREVERLRALVEELRDGGAGADDARLDELERRLAILAGEIETMTIGEAAATADTVQHGLGPAASKIYRTEKGVSIGGYGEMIYQGFDSKRDDGSRSGKTDSLDFLRAVVATGEDGEVAVEFAYVEYRHRPWLNVRAGLLLPPMGFINELHEPTVFLGAKRPEVERVIIPTTWRENGAGLWGETENFSYRAYILNGFDGEGFEASGLRGGRQKGSKAKANDLAFTGRFDYVGTAGLTAGVSLWHGGSGQDLEDTSGDPVDATTTIVDVHLDWRFRGLELRAVGVRGEVDDVAQLNDALGFAGDDSVGETLEGAYVQLGYDVFSRGDHGQQALIPFVRWESLDTQKEVPSGFGDDPGNDRDILTVGLQWQPIDHVVLKAEWQDHDNEAGRGTDQISLLLGYIF